MSASPRDAMDMALEELKRNANLLASSLGDILEDIQEGKTPSEETLRRAARQGRAHEDWIGHKVRRSCFYPKDWKDE